MGQQNIDAKNAEFWDELCGSSLAHSLGITEASRENLHCFDDAYMAYYPYLRGYVLRQNLDCKKVMEIGLGYGTLGQLIVSRGAYYYGLDIAEMPVKMMRYRLELEGKDPGTVKQGSALEIPHSDNSFDYVYTIGCLHHTGNIPGCVSEIFRVLRPGGQAVIMLYNAWSYRQLVEVPLARLRTLVSVKSMAGFAERVRALYDTNTQGQAAPHTDYVSPLRVRRLFKEFSKVNVDVQNFDSYYVGKRYIPRERMLNNIGRVLGLDLYITARK
ncbi:MAG: class I SAM-dependent methyltransferase [Syntrophales bacterium LBB04]|nr:class I SAM-dependent methyltransferase [Syntrophales bacterium LBB04]